MAVPKRRKSKARKRKAKANLGLTAPSVVYCTACGAAALPHRVCPSCGFFQGRVVEVIENKEAS